MRYRFLAGLAIAFFAACASSQQTQSQSGQASHTRLADQSQDQKQTAKPDAARLPDAPAPGQATAVGPRPHPEPKRILGVMPNYRAVSAGSIPPPPTPSQAFVIAAQNSFDYSAFIFTGITSLMAEGFGDHPQLGKGLPGFWRYSWRGFVDKTDGNYLVIWALPAVLHEDERYFAKGVGGIWKRGLYAGSQVLITPNYHGHNTFNAAEIFGRGISQAVSLTYYPPEDRTPADFTEKYAFAVGRDALTNVFREFWPDISYHLRHHFRHRQ